MATTEAESKELVRALTEELNVGNLDVIDELLADDYEDGVETYRTPAEIKDEVRALREAFPDYHEELRVVLAGDNEVPDEDQPEWASGDFVLAQYDATGTHEGEFRGIPPTGNEFETAVIRSLRIEDGEITIWRWMWGNLTLWKDLGVDIDALLDDLPRYVEQ